MRAKVISKYDKLNGMNCVKMGGKGRLFAGSSLDANTTRTHSKSVRANGGAAYGNIRKENRTH